MVRGFTSKKNDMDVSVESCPSATLSTVPQIAPKDVYTFPTPSFHRCRPEELEDHWENLGFSIRTVNGHVRHTWRDGKWDKGLFVAAPYQLLHINSGALHYGISVFEGLKAFACKDGKVRVMNPELNAKRMLKGATALRMPEVPREMFVAAVTEAVTRNRDFVPPYGKGAAMYIRPLLFASGQMLGLAPLAEEYTFFVTVLPAGGYFGKGHEEGIKAIVSEDRDRAAPKGTGAVKAAGNYAADIEPVHSAREQGYGTTLYLDAAERRYVEEFSVCNFVGITHDGIFVTPKSRTILASTTNSMLQQLALDRGLKVEQRPVDFDKEITSFREVGMCGTAAVVMKVSSITRNGKVYDFDNFDVLSELREEFTSIQCGDVKDRHGWMVEVCDSVQASAKCLPSAMKTAVEVGAIMKVDSEVWTEFMYGRERQLLEYVVQNAEAGNPESVLDAIDEFWSKFFSDKGRQQWTNRKRILDETVLRLRPRLAIEIGTYCGYSALSIAQKLPEGGRLVSVEKDALFAAISTKIIEFAGLEDRVKIWIGTAGSEIPKIADIFGTGEAKSVPADFVLCDHSKDLFVHDLKLLEKAGLAAAGTTIMGDTTMYPGDSGQSERHGQDFLRYFSASEKYRVESYTGQAGPGFRSGGITVSQLVDMV